MNKLRISIQYSPDDDTYSYWHNNEHIGNSCVVNGYFVKSERLHKFI